MEAQLAVLPFADDADVSTKAQDREAVETAVIEIMKKFGETVHPCKTKRLKAGPCPQAEEAGFEMAVRLRGAWLDCDGGASEDEE